MSREKKVIDRNTYSPEEAESFFQKYSRAGSELKKIEGEMEIEINAIRKKYESKINNLTTEKEEAKEKLYVFATNNQELFENKKSMDFTHGTIGFRTGTPKLKTLKGFTWPKVIEKVKKHLPDFIRVKEELNKEELIAQRTDPNMISWYKTIGVEVDQDETFFITPKSEEVAA